MTAFGKRICHKIGENEFDGLTSGIDELLNVLKAAIREPFKYLNALIGALSVQNFRVFDFVGGDHRNECVCIGGGGKGVVFDRFTGVKESGTPAKPNANSCGEE
ncbi:hypothetical protein QNA21_28665 [Rhodococcus qingshengii]|uniref:hypothetical protein n=1 Tax=Rhodococcus sp. IEGM 1302 TaxID=3047093 RepID=UPI001F3B2CC8|nr:MULTISPECIES: hypothetical protein [Rhodococcus]MCT6736145.1 hypothetical protein [Rhodococcus qingshengii]MDI9945080.1 hypothetical protein [Rhodococcus sp. IEGM 1302]MDJ0434827.1 hypothetical protein [Rhodococcus qingshengii]WOI87321.1 hypothetical protein R0122_00680 [Rhodococcus qingshengii]